MSFEADLTRCPRPFDPDRGAETAALVHGVSPGILALIVVLLAAVLIWRIWLRKKRIGSLQPLIVRIRG